MIKDISGKELMTREFKTTGKCNRNYAHILLEKRRIKKDQIYDKANCVVL